MCFGVERIEMHFCKTVIRIGQLAAVSEWLCMYARDCI